MLGDTLQKESFAYLPPQRYLLPARVEIRPHVESANSAM